MTTIIIEILKYNQITKIIICTPENKKQILSPGFDMTNYCRETVYLRIYIKLVHICLNSRI